MPSSKLFIFTLLIVTILLGGVVFLQVLEIQQYELFDSILGKAPQKTSSEVQSKPNNGPTTKSANAKVINPKSKSEAKAAKKIVSKKKHLNGSNKTSGAVVSKTSSTTPVADANSLATVKGIQNKIRRVRTTLFK